MNYQEATKLNEIELINEIELKKKSVVIAAMINVVVPGSAHAYCGNIKKAIIRFIIYMVIIMILVFFPILFALAVIFLISDGIKAAKIFNYDLTKRAINQQNNPLSTARRWHPEIK